VGRLTNDAPGARCEGGRAGAGLTLALGSAVSFGLAGALARPLLDNGWSPGAVVLARIALGALIVVPFGIRSLRGDWAPVRRNARLIVMYGVLAVAGAQFCYFSAVSYMQLAPALPIEYTPPVALAAWPRPPHAQPPALTHPARRPALRPRPLTPLPHPLPPAPRPRPTARPPCPRPPPPPPSPLHPHPAQYHWQNNHPGSLHRSASKSQIFPLRKQSIHCSHRS